MGFCAGLLTLLLFLTSGCKREDLKVKQLVEPEYPARARIDGIQGTVQVGVQIGIGGKVLWVHGTGADLILVDAAEENARQWIWGPFPAKFSYPYYHEVEYIFKLQGKPVEVLTQPPYVRTGLPNWIEISAPPVTPNKFIVVPKPGSAPDH
jgi:hypothetical protein